MDVLFIQLLDAYRPSGGMARRSEVALYMGRRRQDSVVRLEHCLQHRLLVAIDWHSQTWLPMFQFVSSDGSLREEVSRPCAELSSVMDDWELASWFVQPQCALQHRPPLQLLNTQPGLVLDAARQERFVRDA